MNALRSYINDQLDDVEVFGCVLNIDVLHKKIQTIAVAKLKEEYRKGSISNDNYDEILKYITYCPYDYESESYLQEYVTSPNIRLRGKAFIGAAISSFLEDIQ